jgi:hypothetical protein
MNQKIINNAISAYFGMWLLLLLPSHNPNIKNDFVKWHAKMAFFLHFLFFLCYMIFIHYNLLNTIKIPTLNISLWESIAAFIFLILFWFLLYGSYKAHLWESFGKQDMQNITQTKTFFEIKNTSLNEEWNLTFILSYIPLLGFINHGKIRTFQNDVLLSNIKINTYFSLLCCVLLWFWYFNLVSFLFLWYIVAVVFASIFLITQSRIFSFQTSFLPTLDEIFLHAESIIFYLKNYFWSQNFQNYTNIFTQTKEKILVQQKEDFEMLSQKNNAKLPFFLIYIPFVNIISLADFQTKYQFHIINGLMITIISTILIFTNLWAWQILLLFPIFYGLWEKNNLSYKFPILFQVFSSTGTFFKKIFFIWKTTKKLHEEVKQTTYDIK